MSGDDNQTIILTGATAGTSFYVSTSASAGTNGTLAGSISIVELVTVSAAAAAGELHSVTINGRNYTYTSVGADTAATIVTALVSAINTGGGDADAVASAGVGGDELVLTPRVQDDFLRVSTSNDSGVNNVPTTSRPAKILRITGTPTVAVTATTRYNYTVTAGGTACTPHPTATGYIELTPNSLLTLTSAAGTDAQTLCNDTPITDIVYKVQFAGNAQVDDPTRFIDGLPTGVTAGYVATQQVEQITITSPGGGYALSDQVTVTINGTSETYTAAAADTQANAVNDLRVKIAALPNISVSAFDAAAGTIDVQADAAGVEFTISTSAGAGTIGVVNQTGTGELTITGQPSVYITQDTTFTYTIRTTGNANGCTEDTETGTIEVQPSEYVHVSTELQDSQEGCPNTAITDIDYYLYGGANTATVTGLPAGLSDNVIDSTPIIAIRIDGTDADDEYTVTIDGTPYGPVTGANDAAVATALVGAIGSAAASDAVSGDDNQTIILTGATAGTSFYVSTSASAGTNGTLAGSISIVELVTVSAAAAAGELHSVTINGRNYTYTSVGADTAATIVTALVSAINTGGGDADAVASAGVGGDELVLTPRVQDDFLRVSTSNDSGVNNVPTTSRPAKILRITGTPTVAVTATTRYNYTVTAGGTACTPHPTATGYIELTPNSLLTLTSAAGTNAQTLCNDTPITDIVYKVQFAGNAQVDDPTRFIDGLPTGVTAGYVATQQVEQITITSPGGGYALSDQVTVTINGTSETYTAAAADTQANAVNDLRVKIAALPNISVSAFDAAAGTIDVQADAAGVEFTISTSAGAGTIGVVNQTGTGELTITGQPSVYITQDTTFTYTIRTTGNANGCTEDTETGTIEVQPSEYVHVSTELQDSQEGCPNTAITDIDYYLYGGANTATVTGLPAGLSDNVIDSTPIIAIRIDGTDADDEYTVTIDGTPYGPVTGANDAAVATALVGAIGSAAASDAVSGDDNQTIILTGATAGTSFYVSTSASAGTNGTLAGSISIVELVTVSAAAAAGELHSVTINGRNYTYTSVGADTAATIVTALVSAINTGGGDADAVASAGVGGDELVLTPRVQDDFLRVSTSNDSGVNNVPTTSRPAKILRITGTPTVAVTATTRYNYTVTAGGTACTPHPTATGYIELTPNSLLTLTSAAGTNAQTLCNDTPITDIVYKVQFAGNAQVDDPTRFIDGLPTGVTAGYVATQQVEQITITSPGGGYALSDQVTVTINGTSETYTAAAADTQANAVNDLRVKIAALPNISVSAFDAAAGTIDVQADAAGVEFTISTSAGAGTIGVVNQTGTGELTITGQPSVYITQDTTFTYTIRTTGNANGCTEDTETGTIEVQPSEYVHVSTELQDSQEGCPNTAITDIDYYLYGGANTATVTGLPAGLSDNVIDSTPIIAIRIDGTDADDEYTVTIDGTPYGPVTGANDAAVATALVGAIGSAAASDAVSGDDNQTIILTGATAGTSFYVSTSASAGTNGTLAGSISIVELVTVSAAAAAGELHSVTINGRTTHILQ